MSELLLTDAPVEHIITTVGTIVEMHLSTVLESLIDSSNVRNSDLGAELLRSAETDMNANWKARSRWFKNAFDIRYGGYQAQEHWEVLIDARNAVVHGGGDLSPNQRTMSFVEVQKLKQSISDLLMVKIQDPAIYAPQGARLAVDIARAFVQHFDAVVLGKYPTIKA